MEFIRTIVLAIRENTEWLYTVIYQNQLFFIDYWSFMHFFSGFILLAIISIFTKKNVISKLILFLLSYELIEISLYFISLNIFKPEIIKDQLTDVIIGLLGGLLWLSLARLKDNTISSKASKVMTSFIISFLWVGFYNYKYNIKFLNTEGLNLWSFSLWFIGSNIIISLFQLIRNRFDNLLISISLHYLSYISALIILEMVGQEVLQIHEISKSNSQPLIFNLIHGNNFLHIFYLTAPFTLLVNHSILYHILQKSKKSISNLPVFNYYNFQFIFSRLKNFISG
jgi:hypothetical protein